MTKSVLPQTVHTVELAALDMATFCMGKPIAPLDQEQAEA